MPLLIGKLFDDLGYLFVFSIFLFYDSESNGGANGLSWLGSRLLYYIFLYVPIRFNLLFRID
jgi:hypothetical protein